MKGVRNLSSCPVRMTKIVEEEQCKNVDEKTGSQSSKATSREEKKVHQEAEAEVVIFEFINMKIRSRRKWIQVEGPIFEMCELFTFKPLHNL